jgi:hypothetical protein
VAEAVHELQGGGGVRDCTGHRRYTGGGPADGKVDHLDWIRKDCFPAIREMEEANGRRYVYWLDHSATRGAEAVYCFSGEALQAGKTAGEAS